MRAGHPWRIASSWSRSGSLASIRCCAKTARSCSAARAADEVLRAGLQLRSSPRCDMAARPGGHDADDRRRRARAAADRRRDGTDLPDLVRSELRAVPVVRHSQEIVDNELPSGRVRNERQKTRADAELFAKHGSSTCSPSSSTSTAPPRPSPCRSSTCDMVLSDGAGFAGFALWGFGMGPHGPDYMAVGDLHADAHSLDARLRAHRLQRHGARASPSPTARASRCKRQLDRLAERGLTLYTGIEPEFMLLTRDADGKLGPFDATDTLDKPCYDYKGLSRASALPRRAHRRAARRRHRRLPDRPRGRERPVRGQLHLRRCADLRRQLHAS